MECKFTVGQDVVCINDKGWQDRHGRKPKHRVPRLNEICRITEIHPADDTVYLSLRGFEIPGVCQIFVHVAFRPLRKKKKKTDIGTFTEILDKLNRRFSNDSKRELENS